MSTSNSSLKSKLLKFKNNNNNSDLKKGSLESLEIPDLLNRCVYSILEQMQKFSSRFQELSSEQKEAIKLKLGLQLLEQGLTTALEEQSQIDSQVLQEFQESESLEEIVLKTSIYSQTFPEFTYKILVYTLNAYILTCFKNKIQPDPELLNFQIFLLKNR